MHSQIGDPRPGLVDARDDFWRVVRDTLVELHRLHPSDATEKVHGLRQKVDSRSGEGLPDIIYHSEPFDVACRLAKRDLQWVDVKETYERIVDRHFRRTGEARRRRNA